MEKNIIIQKLVGVTEKWITFESIVKCLLVEYFRSRKEIDIKFLVKRYYKIFYKYLGYKYTFKFCAYYLFIVISPSLLFLLIRFLLLRKKGIDIKNFIY